MSEEKGEYVAEPKKRKARSASKFLVLKERKDEVQENIQLFEVVADCKTIKDCRNQVAEAKITGELMIVCIRRKGRSTVQETLAIEGL